MLSKLCEICYRNNKCKFCITYGREVGQLIYKNTDVCKTCFNDSCMFCNKFGKIHGQYLYKQYIDYLKNSQNF